MGRMISISYLNDQQNVDNTLYPFQEHLVDVKNKLRTRPNTTEDSSPAYLTRLIFKYISEIRNNLRELLQPPNEIGVHPRWRITSTQPC